MRKFHGLRAMVGVAAICFSFSAFGQSITIDDVLNGDKFPSALKLADITKDYKVLRISISGVSSGMGEFMSAMMPMMAAQSKEPAQPGADLLTITGTYWTTGKTTQIGDKTFLVTYKLDTGITAMMSGNPSMGVSLKLNLVRVDMISTISPEPAITKARLEKALTDAKVPFNDPTTVALDGDAAILSAILFPVFAQARQAAHYAAAISNSKQIALGLLMYCGDYDDVFPYAQSTGAAVKAIAPYTKNNSLWWTQDGRRFLFNTSLGGVSATSIAAPAETILVFIDKPAKDGKREVAFTDGHAKRLSAEEWRKFEPTLHLKIKRTAKKPLPLDYGKEFNTPTAPSK